MSKVLIISKNFLVIHDWQVVAFVFRFDRKIKFVCSVNNEASTRGAKS